MIKHEVVSSNEETLENEKTLRWKMEVSSLGALIIKVKSPEDVGWRHLLAVSKTGDFTVSRSLLSCFDIKPPVVM